MRNFLFTPLILWLGLTGNCFALEFVGRFYEDWNLPGSSRGRLLCHDLDRAKIVDENRIDEIRSKILEAIHEFESA